MWRNCEYTARHVPRCTSRLYVDTITPMNTELIYFISSQKSLVNLDGVLCLVLGFPVPEGHGATGESSLKGHKND